MPQLVLASTSPYRRQLLERLRVPFACVAPGVDEVTVKRALRTPEPVVRELARQKVLAVADRQPGAGDVIVVGSDQTACVDGDLLDKPTSHSAAVRQLQRLQGRPHELLTAVAVAYRGAPGGRIDLVEWVDRTRLVMRTLSDAEIERYVAAEQPLDCAGSYKIEGLGITLFERIDCADQTAIMGLPLLRLCVELRRLGLRLP